MYFKTNILIISINNVKIEIVQQDQAFQKFRSCLMLVCRKGENLLMEFDVEHQARYSEPEVVQTLLVFLQT